MSSQKNVFRYAQFLGLALLVLLIFLWLYKALWVSLFLSVILVFLLIPPLNYLEKKGVSRTLGVFAILVLTLALFVIFLVKFLPYLYEEVAYLLHMLPEAVQYVVVHWIPFIKELAFKYGLGTEQEFDRILSEFRVMAHISAQWQEAVGTVWSTVPKVLGTLVNCVLIPVITFVLLRFHRKINKLVYDLIPGDMRRPMCYLWNKILKTLREVVKGQFLVAMILAFLYVVGFSVISLPAAVAIGLVAGVCRLIPYLDIVVAGVLGSVSVLTAFGGGGQLLWLFLVIGIVQALDGTLITPKVLGGKAGLHPVLVIISVLALGDLWGFWGVVLAIPFVAVLKVVILHLRDVYLKSDFYNNQSSIE